MKYKLLLDDNRSLKEIYEITKNQIYLDKYWIIVRNYREFIYQIFIEGIPEIISFDHDLGIELTGYDCAKSLISFCHNYNIIFPNYLVHSMNPIGKSNIIQLIDGYKRRYQKTL